MARSRSQCDWQPTLGLAAIAPYRCAMLTIGSKAPDFTVLDDEGQARSLKDFAQKNLILWFYPKADTPG